MKFTTTKKDEKLILAICERGFEKVKAIYNEKIDMVMDITATHCNGNPLDLTKLLAADDFNFYHDIFGIAQHLDRNTGALCDCFLPRCTKPHNK